MSRGDVRSVVERLAKRDGDRLLRHDPGTPGWVTNGFWAVAVDTTGLVLTPWQMPALGSLMAEGGAGVPLVEDIALRMPPPSGKTGYRCRRCQQYSNAPVRPLYASCPAKFRRVAP
jgi:hypothetical protein